jgi:hypothetical protein
LSRRDLEVLGWVGEQYAVRADQLAVLLERGERSVQRVVAALRDGRLVEARPLLAGEAAWIWLTSAGVRVTAEAYPLWQPRVGLLAHIEAVNWVRLFVQERSPSALWVCDRQLLRERVHQTEHVPDAVVLDGERSLAIEVELTVKSRERTTAIISELAQRHDAVVYFTTRATRAHLERLDAPERWPSLVVRDMDEARGVGRS